MKFLAQSAALTQAGEVVRNRKKKFFNIRSRKWIFLSVFNRPDFTFLNDNMVYSISKGAGLNDLLHLSNLFSKNFLEYFYMPLHGYCKLQTDIAWLIDIIGLAGALALHKRISSDFRFQIQPERSDRNVLCDMKQRGWWSHVVF